MSKLHILIIEDEAILALELASEINMLGYDVVDYVTTIDEAYKEIKNPNINLILMDINLADSINGIDLYRSFNTTVPVIYITAYKDTHTIQKAVETHPIGYLIKPHNEFELKALLQLTEFKLKELALEKQPISYLSLGFSFDNSTEKLFYEQTVIHLSVNETKLLKLLLEAENKIITYKTIEYEIWGDEVVSDSALRTLIYRLRNKISPLNIESNFNYGIKLQTT